MSEALRCPNCDAPIPEGGHFCIECGQQIVQAATGATQRLPEAAGGPVCAACGTRNPPGAQFCVMCGRPLDVRPTADAPAPQPMPTAASAAPITPAAPAVPATPMAVPMPGRSTRSPAAWGGISGGLFLIGLALIALTNWWWPGILVLVGVVSLVSSLMAGRPWMGLQGALWLFGIAIIAQFDWWWPGILVLVGISVILGSVWRPQRW